MKLKSELKLACGVAALIVFTLIAIINKYTPILRSYDSNLIPPLSRLTPEVEYIMTAVSAVASIFCVWAFVSAIFVLAFATRLVPKHIAISLIAALATTEVLTAITKLLVGVPRPLIEYDGNPSLNISSMLSTLEMMSFPSGHVARFTVLTSYLRKISKVIAILLYSLLPIIAASRVLLNEHYLIDVVGGFLLGIGIPILIDIIIITSSSR